MSDGSRRKARVPPRWFVRLAWSVHRGVYVVTGGRVGLWPARANKWGALRLTTVGRRTGRQRAVIIAYLEDGSNFFTLAMNGWSDGEPAWWLNLQAHPDAEVELRTGRQSIRAHAATGAERSRLWDKWRELDPKLDEYAALRSTETALAILAPRRP